MNNYNYSLSLSDHEPCSILETNIMRVFTPETTCSGPNLLNPSFYII